MKMESAGETDHLVSGLRALAVIANHPPIDLGELARLTGVSTDRARAFVEVFRECGYLGSGSPGGFYVPTDLALAVLKRCVPESEPVTHSLAEPVQVVIPLGRPERALANTARLH